MRFVNVRELKSKTSEILRAAADEKIIITSHGKPVAVVAGIDGSFFSAAGVGGGAGRIYESHADYQRKGVGYKNIQAEAPELRPTYYPGRGERPDQDLASNPLRAIFWDQPELTEESAVRDSVDKARTSQERWAWEWILSRFLERGRVIDVRKYFSWSDIRSSLPELKLSPYARKKWTRLLEVYDPRS